MSYLFHQAILRARHDAAAWRAMIAPVEAATATSAATAAAMAAEAGDNIGQDGQCDCCDRCHCCACCACCAGHCCCRTDQDGRTWCCCCSCKSRGREAVHTPPSILPVCEPLVPRSYLMLTAESLQNMSAAMSGAVSRRRNRLELASD
eukprot:6202450-Pleurochrysis_carterae.AAC.1